MKQLHTADELRGCLSEQGELAYLDRIDVQMKAELAGKPTDTFNLGISPADGDFYCEEISMNFESPARGRLIIKACYKAGEKNFVICMMSEFYPKHDQPIQRKLTLLGDAQTGVIIAMLSTSEKDYADDNQAAEKSMQTKVIGKEEIAELNWTEIKQSLQAVGNETVYQLQNDGFAAFSAGQVNIPPVIYLPFKGYGDLHLKGAHKKGGDIFVFKIATGFANNQQHGLLASQGMMIAFDSSTGAPLVVLKDEGHLTDLRTAIAGRNAAQQLMPAEKLNGIGILGTGVQARLQLAQLQTLYPNCRQLTVWGRSLDKAESYASEMTKNGWQVRVVDTPKQVAEHANLIITTTPSEQALLDADDITYGYNLIIAIGADMPGKVELSPQLLKKANNLLIDSVVQGIDHGNAAGAINQGVINQSDLQEFGNFLEHGFNQRNQQSSTDSSSQNKLIIFLSSGIGVQDLQIVQAVTQGSEK